MKRTCGRLFVLSCVLISLNLVATLSVNAKVVWERTVVEYQATLGESVVVGVFPFRVEDKAVTIESIRTSCGCTTTKLEKMSYGPGETGEIVAHFELGSRVGPQQKFISLKTNDSDHPSQNLELKVYIPYVLKVNPRFVYWNKGSESYHEQTVDLISDIGSDLRIVSITSDSDQLKLRWEAVEDNTHRLFLRPEIPEGETPFFRVIIKIEIDAPVELKQRVFHVYAFMKSS